MKKAFAISAFIVALFGLGSAHAQEFEPFSKWRVDASLPLQFVTNSLLTPTNSRSDVYVSPFLKLSALGSFDDLNYQIYVATGPDVHNRVQEADAAAATAGGRISKTFGRFAGGIFSGGAIYSHNLLFDGIYKALVFQADDFSGYVAYGYENAAAGFSIAPSFMTTYRHADLASQSRFLYTMKVEINQALTEKLILTVTPSLRYYAFTDGTAAGKRNTFPSILGALTYKISDDLNVSGSVAYDRRFSNRAGSEFDNVQFLASINFGHAYDLPKISRAP